MAAPRCPPMLPPAATSHAPTGLALTSWVPVTPERGNLAQGNSERSRAVEASYASRIVYHAVAPQFRDLGFGIAELIEDLGAVLGEFWRWTPGASRRAAEFDRRANSLVPIEFGDHLTMRGMGGGGRLVDRQHRPRGNAAPDQFQRDLVAVVSGECSPQRFS